jgi:hypothetical protein
MAIQRGLVFTWDLKNFATVRLHESDIIVVFTVEKTCVQFEEDLMACFFF